MRRIAQTTRLLPERREEYLALHRAVWLGRRGRPACRAHPQLQHLPARRHPVRLLRVPRRRLRGRPRLRQGRPRNAALVDLHRTLPGALAGRPPRQPLVRGARDLAPARNDTALSL
ncbi:hypothetical protein ACQ4WX_50340 [Streptomyces lasalocidi]